MQKAPVAEQSGLTEKQRRLMAQTPAYDEDGNQVSGPLPPVRGYMDENGNFVPFDSDAQIEYTAGRAPPGADDPSTQASTRDYFRKLDAEDAEWKLNYGPASREGYFASPDSSGIDFGFGVLSGGLYSLTAEPTMGLLGLGDSLIGGIGYELGIENGYTLSRSQQLSNIGDAIGSFLDRPLDSTAGFFSSRWDGMQEAWSNRGLNPGAAGLSFGRNAGEMGGTLFAAGAVGRGVGRAGAGLYGDIRSIDGGFDFNLGSVYGDGVVASTRSPLTYDISRWGEYGLPSDGYFSRTLSREQYLDLKASRSVSFGGKPVEDYPAGMGFISSAEEARVFSTVKDYREGLQLSYDPSRYVLEFQLRETTGLRNVLEAPYPEFVRGGKTGAGFKEWNYPGLNSNDIVNWRVRNLK